MLKREDWIELSRNLDWQPSYVTEKELFPEVISGTPWLPQAAWQGWNEPYRLSYAEYVKNQQRKEIALRSVQEAIGKVDDFRDLDAAWLSSLKVHAATLPLAEFAAVIGNLRAARFARSSAWRTTAMFGALDELRHTQIPLLLFHDLVREDAQFDWTHKFFHSNNWLAIAARHFVDELLLASNPIEFAVAANFVFETGFTNLQFIGLASVSKQSGDRMFEKMVQSIQTDEARHAQIGAAVVKILVEYDKPYVQALVDKWFWRTWRFFSIVTGFSMDYLVPLEARQHSFKEFVQEWVLDQFQRTLAEFKLDRPWYWDEFVRSIDNYHHMVYLSAYTYRATTWFDFALPGPEEQAWLAEKYPATWPQFAPLWNRIAERWQKSGPDVEWFTHGTVPVAFCRLCQFVLCGGTPQANSSCVRQHRGENFIFCSEPCARLFELEKERYVDHKDVVKRIVTGEAPANLVELVRKYFGLEENIWGKDICGGNYGWMPLSENVSKVPTRTGDGSC